MSSHHHYLQHGLCKGVSRPAAVSRLGGCGLLSRSVSLPRHCFLSSLSDGSIDSMREDGGRLQRRKAAAVGGERSKQPEGLRVFSLPPRRPGSASSATACPYKTGAEVPPLVAAALAAFCPQKDSTRSTTTSCRPSTASSDHSQSAIALSSTQASGTGASLRSDEASSISSDDLCVTPRDDSPYVMTSLLRRKTLRHPPSASAPLTDSSASSSSDCTSGFPSPCSARQGSWSPEHFVHPSLLNRTVPLLALPTTLASSHISRSSGVQSNDNHSMYQQHTKGLLPHSFVLPSLGQDSPPPHLQSSYADSKPSTNSPERNLRSPSLDLSRPLSVGPASTVKSVEALRSVRPALATRCHVSCVSRAFPSFDMSVLTAPTPSISPRTCSTDNTSLPPTTSSTDELTRSVFTTVSSSPPSLTRPASMSSTSTLSSAAAVTPSSSPIYPLLLSFSTTPSSSFLRQSPPPSPSLHQHMQFSPTSSTISSRLPGVYVHRHPAVLRSTTACSGELPRQNSYGGYLTTTSTHSAAVHPPSAQGCCMSLASTSPTTSHQKALPKASFGFSHGKDGDNKSGSCSHHDSAGSTGLNVTSKKVCSSSASCSNPWINSSTATPYDHPFFPTSVASSPVGCMPWPSETHNGCSNSSATRQVLLPVSSSSSSSRPAGGVATSRPSSCFEATSWYYDHCRTTISNHTSATPLYYPYNPLSTVVCSPPMPHPSPQAPAHASCQPYCCNNSAPHSGDTFYHSPVCGSAAPANSSTNSVNSSPLCPASGSLRCGNGTPSAYQDCFGDMMQSHYPSAVGCVSHFPEGCCRSSHEGSSGSRGLAGFGASLADGKRTGESCESAAVSLKKRGKTRGRRGRRKKEALAAPDWSTAKIC